MMNQLEQQLKGVNPQAYKKYQDLRKNNQDPSEFLNETINGFNPEQKQQWQQIMSMFNQK